MNIYLHIGTEKTGSSYLQTLAGINREILKSHGYWFPSAGDREYDLKRGRISPGNAKELTRLLDVKDTKKCYIWLNKRVLEAKKNKCHSLVLSNELLIKRLADRESGKVFQEVIHQFKIHKFSFLLIVRDPVDQAVSLYKHHAKGGDFQQLDEWLHSHYDYNIVLKKFLANYRSVQTSLTVRKYSHNSGFLDKVFFNDWLGVDANLNKQFESVNQSLTFSELIFLRLLKENHKGRVRDIYQRFLNLSNEFKSQDEGLKSYFEARIGNYLSKFNSTWEALSKLLSEKEKLSIPKKINGHKNDLDELTFSEPQIKMIIEGLSIYRNPITRLYESLRRAISRRIY